MRCSENFATGYRHRCVRSWIGAIFICILMTCPLDGHAQAAPDVAQPKGTTTDATEAKSATPDEAQGKAPKSDTAAGKATIAPESLEFNDQPVGTTSAARKITVTAAREEKAVVKGMKVDRPFRAILDHCQAEKGNSCDLKVSFAPSRDGHVEDTARITLDGDSQPRSVRLIGIGLCEEDQRSCIANDDVTASTVIVFVVIYLLGFILIRWNMIARPARQLAEAQIEAVRKRIVVFQPSGSTAQVETLLANAEGFVKPKQLTQRLGDFLFWSRGGEIAAWTCIHEAEEQLVSFLPDESVRAAIERAEADLRLVGTVPALALADTMKQAISTAPSSSGSSSTIPRLKALLYEALGMLYDRADTKFATLVSWHNKTAWLLACALLLTVVLAISLGHAVYFFIGAAGGLLSRLSRALYRDDVPTDYGASWSTLFLSPAVGALAGWSGILLADLAVRLQVLGSAITVTWDQPYATSTALALAFVLGFSERLFDGILTQLQSKIQAQPAGASAATATELHITSASTLQPATVGTAYAETLTATGGSPPYIWRSIGGALPDSVALDSSGRLSGTPTRADTFKFTGQVTDAKSTSKAMEVTIQVR